MRIVDLVAEAIRIDGGWVGLGTSWDGRGVLLARLGRTVWIREGDLQEVTLRFLDWGDLSPNGDGIAPTLRLVVHDPARFRVPPPEALRRIGLRAIPEEEA
ncbi:hypothetical protein [Thermoflexus sp.]|uniref:hypothetical protein n=1 Tax=Thermoflexus sp. TaxID=1969742 RepID=UPI002ADE35AF|nr:hypothetical protein [Thermoflexus sp.]